MLENCISLRGQTTNDNEDKGIGTKIESSGLLFYEAREKT